MIWLLSHLRKLIMGVHAYVQLKDPEWEKLLTPCFLGERPPQGGSHGRRPSSFPYQALPL